MSAYLLPEDTIERFAEIAALVDEGYVPRLDRLAAAGLDHASWKQLERYWMSRLAEGNDADLAIRFATTYGRTRASFANTTVSEAGEPRRSGGGGDTDDTVPDGVDPAAHRANAAPRSSLGACAPGAPAGADDEAQTGASSAAAGVDLTVEAAPGAALGGALPFAPPATARPSGSPPPGKRLAYFDTQTGQPLAVPMWVDAPNGPEDR